MKNSGNYYGGGQAQQPDYRGRAPGEFAGAEAPALTNGPSLFDQLDAQKTAQAQQAVTFSELSKKVCISRLPTSGLYTSDDFVQKMLQCCGQLVSWKRFLDANQQPKDGGIAEFVDLKGVFSCYKFLNNLQIDGCVVLVKANQKTQNYFNNLIEHKREEYLEYLAQEKNNKQN